MNSFHLWLRIIPRLSSLTAFSLLLLALSPSLLPLPTSYPPPTFFVLFFFFNNMQTSRACSWVWLKSAECLQDLSKEEPLGHCHGNFDNPDRVQMWLSRAIWECLPPSSLSHCWGQMGLTYPFLVIYVRGKNVLIILVMKTLGPKYFIKNFIWSEKKALQRLVESLVGLGKYAIFA